MKGEEEGRRRVLLLIWKIGLNNTITLQTRLVISSFLNLSFFTFSFFFPSFLFSFFFEREHT